ncbi:M2 family metallopeptidase [Candidatus Parvarchaeota archaeon]|nr:M2 family metallopeptidase [Candidatus Parvarchaeota archaeon]
MKNDFDYRKDIEDIHRLENIIGTCCDDVKEYKFVPLSFSCNLQIYDEKMIGIDQKLFSEVEKLSEYDKKYLSALKMTVYHEIGHTKTYEKDQEYAFNEAAAELYAISKGSIDDYIIEIAVISDIEEKELSEFNQTMKEPKNVVDYLLKHDSVDKWTDREFTSKFYRYGFAKNALDKVNLSYQEIFDRVLKERENIDSLKRDNNLFIDKDMISRK